MDITRGQMISLFQEPLEGLLTQAWAMRKLHHDASIAFAAPGAKHYEVACYKNNADLFAVVSVTGTSCALQCDHCKGKLLESMYEVKDSSELARLGEKLIARGCQGVLISGGADEKGEVPLLGFAEGIAALKQMGLKVIVHTGLVHADTAHMLKECQVDRILLDVVGDRKTIREVFHLDRSPADFGQTLELVHTMGLPVAPHLVVGLYYGQFQGEMEALYQICRVHPPVIVIVVLNPLPGTPMAKVAGPVPEEAARVIAAARILNPEAKIMLGCAKPPGKKKKKIERLALRAGVNSIAYPAEETINYASELGLEPSFSPLCCCLL